MQKIKIMITGCVITGCVVLYACNNSDADNKKEPIPTQAEMVKRGDYLVAALGCDDCHSAKRMGAHGPEVIPESRLSGYPASRPLQKADSNAVKQGWVLFAPDLTSAVGPWGVSFSANITSDATGIGNWTEANFIAAIRTGKMKGLANNRSMLPPMPWYNYARLSDDDLKSIFAYLKSTPAVANVPPAPQQMAVSKQ